MLDSALLTRSGLSELRAMARAPSNCESARSRSPFRSDAHTPAISREHGSVAGLCVCPMERDLLPSLPAAGLPGLPLDELDEMLHFVLRARREAPVGLQQLRLTQRELTGRSLVKELSHVHLENLEDLEKGLE